MATGEQFIHAEDDTQIFVHKYEASSPKAQVILLHGYLEHCGPYQEFGEYLTAQNISLTTFDSRGHGKSGGPRAVIRCWSEHEQDFEAARSTLVPSDQLPTFILGHSNGGLCTLNYCLGRASDDDKLKGFKGVILTNPYVEATDSVPWLIMGVVHALGRWFPSIKVPSNLKAESLTSDPEKQKEHDADDMMQTEASIGWASQALKTQARVKKLTAATKSGKPFPLPLLYIYSTEDKVANPKAVQHIGETLQADDKTIVVRDGEQHEVLNEKKRTETYKIISDWVLKHLS